MAEVSAQECQTIAQLARLSLSGEETKRFALQVEKVLTYVETLQTVNIEGVPEYVFEHIRGSSLRSDQVGFMLSQEEVLKGAPENHEGFVVVPKFKQD